MKALLDFLPLFAFFAAYKLYGIYTAAAVLIAASSLVYGGLWLLHRRLEKSQWFTWLATVGFSAVTLMLHDETWLKWKAPVINWVFALVFLGSQFVGEKPLARKMLESALDMPAALWTRLNLAWVAFFVIMGIANAAFAFYIPRYWVDFKVWGSLICTLLFMVAQLALLSRYLKPEEKS